MSFDPAFQLCIWHTRFFVFLFIIYKLLTSLGKQLIHVRACYPVYYKAPLSYTCECVCVCVTCRAKSTWNSTDCSTKGKTRVAGSHSTIAEVNR